ncbi:L,D-transpeptidase [Rubritalea marina]|uniref:L,D-transpeptidase n=1 Tax=Rubritalea marina TaxID=361055 RepID=UPI00036FD4F1|nr:L,D-transpeptidase [Rubritalea marina]
MIRPLCLILILASSCAFAQDVPPVKPTEQAAAPVVQKAASKQVEVSAKRLRIATLQIFLDQEAFGPGVIDGKIGTFTERAIETYIDSKGLKSESELYQLSQSSVSQPLQKVIVPDAAQKYVDTDFQYGDDRVYQASRKDMPYRSVGEFMAERYHTTVEYLMHLNGRSKINNAFSGKELVVPNINPFRIEAMSIGRGFGKDPILSARWAVVDTGDRQIRIYEPLSIHPPETKGGFFGLFKKKRQETLEYGSPDVKVDLTAADEAGATLVAAFPITPGKPQFIRRGTWKMKNSVQFPTWRFDDALLKTGKYSKDGLVIPSGPNSPVGVHWMGLTRKGVGIHGTDNPSKIGRGRSSGCVRMANWDAARMPSILRPGAVVIIK